MAKRTPISRAQLLEDLQDSQKATHYLNAAAEDSDTSFLIALYDVASSRHLPTVSRSIGLARQALYRMLSPTGNPTYGNLRKIVKALGLKLVVEPLPAKAGKKQTAAIKQAKAKPAAKKAAPKRK